ncbi:MAG: tyrosine-type recombinase/integrase [bacterium]
MARKGSRDRGIVEKPRGSGIWWVRLTHRGREKWYRTTTKTEAQDLYGRLRAEIREGRYFPEKYDPPAAISLRAWIARCLEGSTNRGVVNERRYGRRWSLYLGARSLTDLTTEDIRLVQARMRAKLKPQKKEQPLRRLWSDATVNRHVAFIGHVLRLAITDGKLARHPLQGIKKLPEATRTRFLTDAELSGLRNVMARADWQLVAFAVETGLRRGEQFSLRWDQVDLENGVLTLPLPKGGRTRHVPLSEAAKAILRSLESFLRSAWVFPGLRQTDSSLDSRAFLRRAFEPALRQAGIRQASWHTLRHTAASRRVMAGVDLLAVKELLGHRDIQTTMRYAHLSPGHLTQAVNRGSLTDIGIGTGSKTGSEQGRGSRSDSEVVESVARPEGLEPPALRSVV